ncbi:hypothetical protein, partial [Brevibacillus agri]|uniref:hypothetical protein n=1 Tax=Brevibacillus agri TaxID=51101 RepID=UPI003D247CD8
SVLLFIRAVNVTIPRPSIQEALFSFKAQISSLQEWLLELTTISTLRQICGFRRFPCTRGPFSLQNPY